MHFVQQDPKQQICSFLLVYSNNKMIEEVYLEEQNMKCPYCNNEMELGCIQCRDGVAWSPKKQLIAALAILGKGSFYLKNAASENGRTVYAYRCKECKKIIIDYVESTDSKCVEDKQ